MYCLVELWDGVCHLWYNEETQKKVLYNRRIEKQKRKDSDKYVVAYWDNDECEDDAVEYDVSKFELGVDLIWQDLTLC